MEGEGGEGGEGEKGGEGMEGKREKRSAGVRDPPRQTKKRIHGGKERWREVSCH